jgi:hypothetical protein
MAGGAQAASRPSAARGSVVAALLIFGTIFASLGAGVVGSLGAQGSPQTPGALEVAGIPPDYVAAYEQAAARFELGPDGWSMLAGIGSVESDHGRSTQPGVSSGQNFHGCCAGPMQIHNGFGTGTATWGAYAVDGNGDGRKDIYDIADAAPTAAHYLRASGAPDDWRRAVLAYNHDATYVAKVLELAAQYRAAAKPVQRPVEGSQVTGDGLRLADVPGFPGERCDARIVADVLALTTEFGLHLSDCYGGAPHDRNGEHPLGLAVDMSPKDGDWSRTMRLARTFGWSPSCAVAGCPGRGPFRVVLYNGYPDHGDPQHSSIPHIHLSWQHGPAAPFTRAPGVRVLIRPASASKSSSSSRTPQPRRSGRKEKQ